MNRRKFIKAGGAATIGMMGLAGCTTNCEDDECEFEGEDDDSEGEGDDFDSLADEPAASNAEVDLSKGSEDDPWTEDDVDQFMEDHE